LFIKGVFGFQLGNPKQLSSSIEHCINMFGNSSSQLQVNLSQTIVELKATVSCFFLTLVEFNSNQLSNWNLNAH